MYTPNKTSKRVKIFDFSDNLEKQKDKSLKPFSVCDSYNFCQKSGVLKDGFGVAELKIEVQGQEIVPKIPAGIEIIKAYFYKKYDDQKGEYDNRLLVYCSDKYIYQYRLNSGEAQFERTLMTFAEVPSGLNYKLNGEDIFIFSARYGLVVFKGDTYFNYSAPKVTSMCLNGERLFITTGGEQTSLWFSAHFDPTNWYVSLDEAGFIDFQDGLGKLNKVISFNDSVYVFRETGITKVVGYYDQQSFYAQNIEASRDRIFSSSVTECGNQIIYLTEKGFVSFNGSSFYQIMTGLTPILENVDNSDAHGVYFGGRLYMSVNVKIEGEMENRIICYDLYTGSYYLVKGMKVKQFLPIYHDYNKLAVVVEGNLKLGELTGGARCFDESLKKFWKMNAGNFGIMSEKIISKLSIKTYGNIVIEIKSDLSAKRITLNGRKTIQHAIVGIRGNEFEISIEASDVGSYVPQLSFEILYE